MRTMKAGLEALQTESLNILRNTLLHRSCTKLKISELPYLYAHFAGARDPSTANKGRGAWWGEELWQAWFTWNEQSSCVMG